MRPHKNKPLDYQKQIVVTEKEILKQTKSSIRIIRGQEVILAADVALIYGDTTKRINERVKRHPGKFPPDFMFQLSKQEFESLRSQFATSKLGRGGTKYLPYSFTEHGVLQIANLINTELADSVSVFVIRAFVEMRRTLIAQQKALVSTSENASKIQNVSLLYGELLPKLQSTIGRILESVIDTEKGITVKDEALDILKESINNLKQQLRKKGLKNEEITARVSKLLAEAEYQRATARRTRAESEQIEFMNTIKKLRLVLEAQLIMDSEGGHKGKQKLIDIVEVLKDVVKNA